MEVDGTTCLVLANHDDFKECSACWLGWFALPGATSKPGEGDQLLQASGAQKRDMGDVGWFCNKDRMIANDTEEM